MSNIKILAKVDELVEDGDVHYAVSYRLSGGAGPGNTFIGGTATVPLIIDETETETNARVQLAVADDANLQTENTESFTVDDVRGGRI
jgi:hypothetical protein